jgi:hypothetical protein
MSFTTGKQSGIHWTWAVPDYGESAAVLFLLFVVRFSLCERKTNNS